MNPKLGEFLNKKLQVRAGVLIGIVLSVVVLSSLVSFAFVHRARKRFHKTMQDRNVIWNPAGRTITVPPVPSIPQLPRIHDLQGRVVLPPPQLPRGIPALPPPAVRDMPLPLVDVPGFSPSDLTEIPPIDSPEILIPEEEAETSLPAE